MLFNYIPVLALWLSCSFLVKLDKAGVFIQWTLLFAQSSFPESDIAGLVCVGLFCSLGLCFKFFSNVKYSWGRELFIFSCVFSFFSRLGFPSFSPSPSPTSDSI